MEKREEAQRDYLAGMKYKDIAEKYDVSINTVKSWKQRDGWSREGAKKGAHKTEKGAHKKIAPKAKEILQETNLEDWEEIFCLEYLRTFNKTKAYHKARPDVTYGSASVEGSRMFGKPKIQQRLAELKSAKQEQLFIEGTDIDAQWAKQAFADITDFIEFRTEISAFVGDDGEMTEREHLIVSLKDSDKIDGMMVKEFKMTRDGPVIKLYDSQKALEMLQKRLLNVDEISAENTKANTELTRAKLSLIKGVEHDMSLMQTLLDVLKGDEETNTN